MGYSYDIILQGFNEEYSEWSDLNYYSNTGSFHSTDQHYFYTQSETMDRVPSGESGVSVYYFSYEKMKKDVPDVKFDFKKAARELLNQVDSLEEYIGKLQLLKYEHCEPLWREEFTFWWENMQIWRDSYRQLRIKFTVMA